jgi:lipoprotein-anchoring transpeptidase ErfK/SrfK
VPNRVLLAAAALVTAAGLLSSCSSGGSTPAAAPAPSSSSSSAASSAPAVAPLAAPATPASSTSKPAPAPNPCATNRHAQFVKVSLKAQHLWTCSRTRLVEQTPITSGMTGEYTETPTGTFHIQGRDRNTVLTLNTGKQYDVKYWIPFQAPLYGFHDSSWQDFPYGSAQYRTDGSHGCVHMPLKAIAFLYSWAAVGATVHIGA